MFDSKTWWQSRTVWVNIITGIFAVLAFFKVGLPADLSQDSIVTAIMAVVSVVNIVLRLLTTKTIAATPST